MIKISVIIPVYNVEQYLEACLESVLRQDFEEMEILCVDDCSTDGSRAILERYAAEDRRIQIISYEENGGLSYARNRAMERAQGEYLFFLDSDDMVGDGAFQTLYETAAENHLDAVRMDMEELYDDSLMSEKVPSSSTHHGSYAGTYTGQQLFAELLRQKDYSPAVWFFLWRRDFLQENNIRFHEGILHEDLAFTFAGLAFAERVQVQLGARYIYRRRASSITTKPYTVRNVFGHIACYEDNLSVLRELHHDTDDAYLRAVNWYFFEQFRMCHGMINTAMKSNPTAFRFENDAQAVLYERILHWGDEFLFGTLPLEMLEGLRKREIILYGAGKIGMEILRCFETMGIQNYHLAVTKKDSSGAKGLAGMAHELRELQNFRESALVIVATGAKLHTQMEEEARRQGFQHIVWYANSLSPDAYFRNEVIS